MTAHAAPRSAVLAKLGTHRPLLGIALLGAVLIGAGAATYYAVGNTAPQHAALAVGISTSMAPRSAGTPVTIEFSATASGGTAPYSYTWTFSDGSIATGSPATHTFPVGTSAVNAKLVVIDAKGEQASSAVAIST